MASAIIGTLLMLTLTLMIAAPVLKTGTEFAGEMKAYADETRTNRERAEHAAACAQDPTMKNCNGPHIPGHTCERVRDTWVCYSDKKGGIVK